ncbi:MAG TPA: SUMF1/EgtB/PvdO family nonheme iron enzyme, partial [Fimbriimonas sp.]|nr:SUMF1/EgtB/PvdO family nonheme iron enzyme [Fimbriimonas sp.]
FDFYRDMPGGLPELKKVVDRCHRRGVKVYIDYNPWDQSTRREPMSDEAALAKILGAINADGIFLDTLSAANPNLRKEVDAVRKGVVFEPEGSPSEGLLGDLTTSWAQWLSMYDGADARPGILRLKWLEPRHMQHQIRRWDRSHMAEIETAIFNGSGMLIWENVFGSYNPWDGEDRLTWRRAVPVLRAFAGQLSSQEWEPFVPTLHPGVFANRWPGNHADLYTIWNKSGGPLHQELLKLPPGAKIFDLWSGKRLDKADPLIDRMGLLGVAWDEEGIQKCEALMAKPNAELSLSTSKGFAPLPVERTKPGAEKPDDMVLVPGAKLHMLIHHPIRECGCYPDPQVSDDVSWQGQRRSDYFTYGSGGFEEITHSYEAEVKPFLMDKCLVTNAQYAAFLKATGYKPKDSANFLKHWPGGICPPVLLDHPVVYVDLEDARAYAKWADKRLPTEEEWQLAGQGTDFRKWPWGKTFDALKCGAAGSGTHAVTAFPEGRSPYGCYDMAGNVWQWTESERDDGHTRFAIVRGGSYFDATGSVWYISGGPKPLDYHAKVLLMSPSLDRCATVGFRCVRDVKQ